MNVSSYSDLQSTIASYLARSDLTDQIPSFIQFAEYRLRRELRIRQMLKSVTTTTTGSDPTVELPSDFLEVRDFYVVGNPNQSMSYQSPSAFTRLDNSGSQGKPLNYTVLANDFKLAPTPDTAYTVELLYYAAPALLSSSNSSNVFLANVPDLLLYASLIEAEPYLMNDARLSTWISMYEKAVNQINLSNEQGQYSGVPLAMKAV